jgi:hypothetical protein
MSVVIKKRAENSIGHTIEHIKEEGYPITSVKYLDRILSFFQELDRVKLKHQLCKKKTWAKFHYRCVVLEGKYVVAYKIKDNNIVICYFTHGAKLK